MSKNSGKTNRQLEAENARLRAKLDALAVGDSLRFEGEEWFELVEYFDPEAIKRIPTASVGVERAYMMGYVEDVWIVEVPRTTSEEAMNRFNTHLRAMGITAPFLTVTDDMRFLKLARATPERAEELDRAEVKKLEDAMRERAEAAKRALVEGKSNVETEAPRTESGHCPECGEEGYATDHGCVYCGLGRTHHEIRPHDAGPRSEPPGDGLGGPVFEDASHPSDRGDQDAEGSEEGSPASG